LAGEVEARTTQSRLDLDPQQRRENYPFDYKTYGYDVPAKSQTVDFGNNKANAQRPLTEFEQAHLTAQRNAALPVDQGGLGLPANNTAMDRARAMGFDEADYYHGTRQDFNNFDVNKTGTSTDEGFFGDAVYSTKRPADASEYAQYDLKEALPRLTDNGIVVPLKIRKNAYQTDKAALLAHDVAKIKKDGYDSIENSLELASFDPKNIRSRFAAFDPFNRESSNLLAQSAKLAPTTALGAYMYNEKRKKSQGKQ